MIENTNSSKSAFVTNSNSARYIGVASLHIVAVNPNNETLKKYGWIVPEEAEEQKYVVEDVDENGKISRRARLRFLAQITDYPDKPVIALDFTCRPEMQIGKNSGKCKIIDVYGRTAWATKEEAKARQIPQYTTGPANISTPYKPCHPGEEEVITMLFKYLNISPFRKYDSETKEWVDNPDKGKLAIDDWNNLCNGNVDEILAFLKTQPFNSFKVILGIRSDAENNRTYQTFLNTDYLPNYAKPDDNTGEYTRARKLIDMFYKTFPNSPARFNATPVQKWEEKATEVKDNSSNLPDDELSDPTDDLPF